MKRKASDLLFCGCRGCKGGMHTPYGSSTLARIRRAARRTVKRALKMGNIEVDRRVAVGYLD